jgi:hypothetical protein
VVLRDPAKVFGGSSSYGRRADRVWLQTLTP